MKYLITALSVLFLVGCGATVPPGTTVMILHPNGTESVKTEGSYKAWGRDRLYFVSTKLKSYSKNISVLCADDINMDVSLKWMGAFDVKPKTLDVIKKQIPATPVNSGDIKGYELSLDKFFIATMADLLSATARTVISPYKTDNIRAQREKIAKEIKRLYLIKIEERNYPVKTADVLLTNLEYPLEITNKRKKIKDAELADLENAAIAKAEVAKARRKAELASELGKAKLVEAKADAAANKVRGESLTPEILAVKQLETLVKLAEGENNTVVVIPFEAMRPGLENTLLQKEAMDRVASALRR